VVGSFSAVIGPSVFLSDLNFGSTPTNGLGPVERDKSVNTNTGGDGHTLTLNGTTYAKGLGTAAISSITYNLDGEYTFFVSDIGVDDEIASGGSVVFQVFCDGIKDSIPA
jgi:hypothetical protein